MGEHLDNDGNVHVSDSSSSEPSVVELGGDTMDGDLWRSRIQEMWQQRTDLLASQRGRSGRWMRGRGLARGGRGRQALLTREEPMQALLTREEPMQALLTREEPPLETRAAIQEMGQQHSDLFPSRPHTGRWIGRARGGNRSSGRGLQRG